MVVLKFYRDKALIGAKEFLTDEKAEKIGQAWLVKAKKEFPAFEYHFEMLKPTFLVRGKKMLHGEYEYKGFSSISDAVSASNHRNRIEIVFKTAIFGDLGFDSWEGDLII